MSVTKFTKIPSTGILIEFRVIPPQHWVRIAQSVACGVVSPYVIRYKDHRHQTPPANNWFALYLHPGHGEKLQGDGLWPHRIDTWHNKNKKYIYIHPSAQWTPSNMRSSYLTEVCYHNVFPCICMHFHRARLTLSSAQKYIILLLYSNVVNNNFDELASN